jgi:hypothetical protein
MKDDVDKQAACQLNPPCLYSDLQGIRGQLAGLDCHDTSLS